VPQESNLLEPFFKLSESIYPLSADAQYALTQKCEVEQYAKKDIIWQEGKPVAYAYFLLSGIVRSFYPIDGKDITANFLQEGEMLISLNSFYHQQPDHYSIECLEPVQVAKIAFSDLKLLLSQYLELNYLARVLAHQYIMKTDARLLLLRKMSAKEKWEYFNTQHSDLVQRIALGHIASYLGINQETLSRMRK
jgi:CRP/FNR family transcriptional regulator, anaerobic regulatory protein